MSKTSKIVLNKKKFFEKSINNFFLLKQMENFGDELRSIVEQKKQQEKNRKEQEEKAEKERIKQNANDFCKIIEEEVLQLIADPMRRAAEEGYNSFTCSIRQNSDKHTVIDTGVNGFLSQRTFLRIPDEKDEAFAKLFWLSRSNISDHLLFFFVKKYKLRFYKKTTERYGDKQMDITFNWGKNDKKRKVDDDDDDDDNE